MVRIYTDRTQNKILNPRQSVLFPRNPWLEEKQPPAFTCACAPHQRIDRFGGQADDTDVTDLRG